MIPACMKPLRHPCDQNGFVHGQCFKMGLQKLTQRGFAFAKLVKSLHVCVCVVSFNFSVKLFERILKPSTGSIERGSRDFSPPHSWPRHEPHERTSKSKC